MKIVALIEMNRSLELNKTRFDMSQQLYQILMNTVVEYFEE